VTKELYESYACYTIAYYCVDLTRQFFWMS